MTENDYAIKLDIFEGPMDLLVYLVRKHDMDVTDIPISEITEQYLAYLDLMTLLNIDFAADFLYMAATLAHIKSRSLLPSQNGDEEEEDPRLEIARPLMEYLRLKSAAGYMGDLPLLGRDTFKAGYVPEDGADVPEEDPEIQIGLYELVEAFREVLDKQYKDHAVDFSSNKMTVKDRILEIVALFEKTPRISFRELLSDHRDKSMVVLTFLAILEMAKISLIEITQHVQSGMIHLNYL